MYQKPVTSFAVIRHVFHERTWRSLRIYVCALTYTCLRESHQWDNRQYGDELNKLYFHARPSTTSTCDQVLLPNAALWCEIKFHRAITIPPCTPICRAILYLKQKKLENSLAESPNFPIFAPTQIANRALRIEILLEKGRLRTLSSTWRSRKSSTRRERNRNVRVGCIVPCCIVSKFYNTSRRGLSRVAYPCTRQCESPHVG